MVEFVIRSADRNWIEAFCRDNTLEVSFCETDKLTGGEVLLSVGVPILTVTVPCVAKILTKLIEQNGPTSVSCGSVKIDKVKQKEVLKVLEKILLIENERKNGSDK